MVRIPRPAEALVAGGERLVNENASDGNGPQQMGYEGAMQIVGHDNPGERPPRDHAAFREHGCPVLQIDAEHLGTRVAGEIAEAADVTVQGRHPIAEAEEEAGVPTGAGGKIQNRPFHPNQRCEANDPVRGLARAMAPRPVVGVQAATHSIGKTGYPLIC